MSDSARLAWNERYAQSELVWSAGPNQFVRQELERVPPGTALDLGAGEGRNALWLAEQGWRVTAVDFSDVAIAKARRLSADRGLDVNWEEADLVIYQPPDAFDLVVIAYVHLPTTQMSRVLEMAAAAVAPGGQFLLVGHDISNISRGYGGPQDPAVLYGAEDVARHLAGFEMDRAETVDRMVATEAGERRAIDVLVRARKSQA